MKNNIVTKSEAAIIAGVQRQAIGDIRKKGTYNFFIKREGEKEKVDLNSDDWKKYIIDRESNGKPKAEKKKIAKPTNKGKEKDQKEKPDKIVKKQPPEKKKQEHALTGGYDPSLMIPTTPAQLKALTDIAVAKINMQVKLNELIDVKMVISILEIVSRDIGGIRGISRKVSSLICSKLDSIGMEKQVEKIIDVESESIIKMLKKNMAKNIDIESYK